MSTICHRPVPVGIATPVAWSTPPRETVAPRSARLVVNLTGPVTSFVVHFRTFRRWPLTTFVEVLHVTSST